MKKNKTLPDKLESYTKKFIRHLKIQLREATPAHAILFDMLAERYGEEVRKEQREKDAKIVDRWHIKKGGFCTLADKIRNQK